MTTYGGKKHKRETKDQYLLAYKGEVRKKTEFGWEDCEFILPDTEFPTLGE